MRDVAFTPQAIDDLEWWLRQDRKVLARVLRLVRDAAKDPFTGPGKPEPLKGNYAGVWARRITAEHRLLYSVAEERIRILGCRYHYD